MIKEDTDTIFQERPSVIGPYELAASAAQENYRARFNRVFDVGSDHLYRKGMKFKLRT